MVRTRDAVARWIEAYERAWRTAGTDGLRELFTDDVRYVPSPWRPPIEGLKQLAIFWDAGRDGPDEPFTMSSELVAVDGDSAVVRVEVEYLADGGGSWRDLWMLRFASDGRCARFEEWPFAPSQRDGHAGEG
ncbi:MAG: nuclear transport factor 2 family protein [Chloroflexi bacterium]|nr:nuclear transport factor 2 family protein [Chloroflexota bacterium]